jgi:hypothetical protein
MAWRYNCTVLELGTGWSLVVRSTFLPRGSDIHGTEGSVNTISGLGAVEYKNIS